MSVDNLKRLQAIDIIARENVKVFLDTQDRMQEEEEGDTLTILAGEDMGDDEFDALVGKIEDSYPDLDIDPLRGEQPLYPVIFSIE